MFRIRIKIIRIRELSIAVFLLLHRFSEETHSKIGQMTSPVLPDFVHLHRVTTENDKWRGLTVVWHVSGSWHCCARSVISGLLEKHNIELASETTGTANGAKKTSLANASRDRSCPECTMDSKRTVCLTQVSDRKVPLFGLRVCLGARKRGPVGGSGACVPLQAN